MPARQIIQSPEEEQLDTLLQLAQLNHLTTTPQQEQQNLDQTDMRNRVAAAIQLMGMKQEHEHQLATEEQARTALAETIKTREAGQEANVTDALISELSKRPDVPLSVLATTLRKRGHSQLADTLDEVHVGEVNKQTEQHLARIKALGGDQKKLDIYLPTITDPDVLDKVKAALPQVTTPSPTTEVSGGTQLGRIANLLQNPDAAILSGFQNVYNYGKNSQGIKDFWSALLNKKTQPATTY